MPVANRNEEALAYLNLAWQSYQKSEACLQFRIKEFGLRI